jgi:hypothetical protein
MGPLLLMGNGVDDFEWAHFCSFEKVSMTLNMPIVAHVDEFEWARRYS